MVFCRRYLGKKAWYPLNSREKRFWGGYYLYENFWRPVGRLIEDFPNLIEDGDRILVAISGGEDSIVLLDSLWRKLRKSPVKYTLGAAMVLMGWHEVDPVPIEEYCRDKNIPFYIEESRIAEVVDRQKEQRSPCSICSSYRRTILYSVAHRLGYNKLALGHHLDDIISSFFMSLFYSGELKTTCPMVQSEDKTLYIIRPLSYVRKKVISRYFRRMSLPLVENRCPYEGLNNRGWIEEWFSGVERKVKFADANILGALRRSGIIFKER